MTPIGHGDVETFIGDVREIDVDPSGLLSASEEDRARQYATPNLQHRFRTRRAWLRALLIERLGENPTIGTGPFGKPYLVQRDGMPDLRFNMADSGNMVAIAIAHDAEVGIDIECARDIPNIQDLANRYFTMAEASALRALSPDAQNAAFFRCWTRKEALMKAHGKGMALGLETLDVGVEEALSNDARIELDGRTFWLKDLPVELVDPNKCTGVVALGRPVRHIYRC